MIPLKYLVDINPATDLPVAYVKTFNADFEFLFSLFLITGVTPSWEGTLKDYVAKLNRMEKFSEEINFLVQDVADGSMTSMELAAHREAYNLELKKYVARRRGQLGPLSKA